MCELVRLGEESKILFWFKLYFSYITKNSIFFFVCLSSEDLNFPIFFSKNKTIHGLNVQFSISIYFVDLYKKMIFFIEFKKQLEKYYEKRKWVNLVVVNGWDFRFCLFFYIILMFYEIQNR